WGTVVAIRDIVAIEVPFRTDPGLDLAAFARGLWAALAAHGPVGQPSWDTPALVHLRQSDCRVSLGLDLGPDGRVRFVSSALPLGTGRPERSLDIARTVARRVARGRDAAPEIWPNAPRLDSLQSRIALIQWRRPRHGRDRSRRQPPGGPKMASW
ncbi:MAG TPA: hypothetical protein VHQ65_12780, partial [Thermoanaerobaculia bacterium]|nr:hypothetical protein [Thermoanaerobaculia bacterium]